MWKGINSPTECKNTNLLSGYDANLHDVLNSWFTLIYYADKSCNLFSATLSLGILGCLLKSQRLIKIFVP